MVLCNKSVITNTCKFVGISPPGTISVGPTGEFVMSSKSGGNVTGFASILEQIIKSSKSGSGLLPSGAEELAQLRQWLEFCISVVNFADSQNAALKELNNRLADVSFLIEGRVTVADAILFYTVYTIMSGASMHDKENLCHISRWFSTIQHQPGILAANQKLITFSRNHLYQH